MARLPLAEMPDERAGGAGVAGNPGVYLAAAMCSISAATAAAAAAASCRVATRFSDALRRKLLIALA